MQGVVDADQQSAEATPRPKKVGRWNPFRRAEPSGNQRRPYERKHPLDWAVFILLFLTTIATGFAAYFTHNQWLTAQDTEKRQLRAYLFIDRDTAQIKGGTQITDLAMSVKNFGQTPAYNVSGAAWLGILDWPLPLVMDLPHRVSTPFFPIKVILAQGAPAPIHVRTIWPLTDAEIKEVRGGGTKKLVTYGYFNYEDIFKEPHITLFCMGLMLDVYIPGRAEDCNQHTNAN